MKRNKRLVALLVASMMILQSPAMEVFAYHANVDGVYYEDDEETTIYTGWVEETTGEGEDAVTTELYVVDGQYANGVQVVDGVAYTFENGVKGDAYSGELDGKEYKNGTLRQGIVRSSDNMTCVEYVDGVASPYTGLVTGTTGYKYYYVNGKSQSGLQKVGDELYVFDATTGRAKSGWQTIDSKKYYFGDDYAALTGEQRIDDKVYYFSMTDAKLGQMLVGKITIDGTPYYQDKTTGARVYSKLIKISGKNYYFQSEKVNGERRNGAGTTNATIIKAQKYSSNTKHLLLVNKKSHHVSLFTGKKGHWDREKYYIMSCGRPANPTPTGTFKISKKKLWYSNAAHTYTAWYKMVWNGHYLFHSVLYKYHSETEIKDGRLGQSVSHGCIRMNKEEVRYIYNKKEILGTKVVVY